MAVVHRAQAVLGPHRHRVLHQNVSSVHLCACECGQPFHGPVIARGRGCE
jgi:hypothetical protein